MSDAPGVVFASFGRRLAAALLDSAVWIIGGSWVLGSFSETFYEDHPVVAGVIVLVVLSAWFNYFAICEWRFGQTIGKNAFGLRVVPIDAGARLTYNAAAIRNLLRLVDLPLALIGVDYVMVRNSPRRQRLGDRAARTVVIRESSPAPQPAAEVQRGAVAAPTSGELFGDAASALRNAGVSSDAEAPDEEGRAAVGPQPPQPAAAAAPPSYAPTAPRPFPYSTWGPRAAVVGVLAAIGIGLVLGLPAIIIDSPPEEGDLSTGASVALQLATVIGFVVAPLYLALQGGATLRLALERLGVRRFGPSALKWMAAAVGVYLVLVSLYALAVTPEQEDVADAFGPVWIQVLLIVIAASISEELCFRGMLFGGLRERIPSLAAALLSGLIFGALHAITGITAVPPLIIFGTVLALLYERTGSILPGVLLHALNNSVALLAQ